MECYHSSIKNKKARVAPRAFFNFNREGVALALAKVRKQNLYIKLVPIAMPPIQLKEAVMPKVGTISVTGASGRTYSFDVYPWGSQFNPVGGGVPGFEKESG